MTFAFGPRSEAELVSVHPKLVTCVRLALELSSIDFGVNDGLRTLDEQKKYLASGASHTLNSKHLPQADGFGHAVDLVPSINGKLRWEWPPIHEIAKAMWWAAEKQGLELTWGGVWDRPLHDLNPDAIAAEVTAYGDRRRKLGRDVFTDGPHFELFW